ncbi:glycoside hydrolase family 43 protein [Desertihabitans aurantiacus]|uniref:glycoside hydrolase family 43 protein n=1 Tax=Desertihabitans aurantiacus TaxID=2282477 RepID=UPI000DF7E9A0|nr:glycoside hydrolase 43 family protein [Desertihabitans aurantiacus]
MHRRSNPVLDADWPDPDAIRVGEEIWMVASSFNRAPGLPLLRSRDLVDWEHVTNALPALEPAGHYALPRRGSGVWAPSIREHDGEVFLVYPDPDHGIFVLRAPHPSGPWSTPHLLLPGRGLIDPCPLWDEDGRAYLVHGWARSRARVKNRLSLVEITPDLRSPLGPGEVIIDGDALDMTTLEGPKAYRHDGYVWIWAPAGGVADGYQVVFRARHPRGPFEHRVVLAQQGSSTNGPHQGALVDDATGAHWFLHFQDRGVFGRVVHLQPVVLGEDGWPHVGEPVDEHLGRPVDEVPLLGAVATGRSDDDAPGYREPLRSDDFATPGLHPRWHWQANPDPQWVRADGDGRIGLAAVASPRGDLRDHGAVLGQQLPGRPSVWRTTLELPALAPGSPLPAPERAGVVVLGHAYAWAGLRRDADGVSLVSGVMGPDDADEVLTVHRRLATDPAAKARVRLSVAVDAAGRVTLTADDDVLLDGWQSREGHWIGAEVGLFAAADGLLGAVGDDRRAQFGPVAVEREGEAA